MKVSAKLEAIKQQIDEACQRVQRDAAEVQPIAVTKYVSVERAQEALEAGIKDLGENRAEGLLEKWEVLKDKPVWHFIGSLQTRKVKNIIDKVDYIHSLDRFSLAEEIQKRAAKKIKCFVQVNILGEESKHGLQPHEVLPFIERLQALDKIVIVGLMTMAPLTQDEELLRDCFGRLRELRGQVQARQFAFAPCGHLSMGMSNDFHIAIEEGATMIRIGTALVGEDVEEVSK